MRLRPGASGAERFCALGAIGRLCAAPQLHRWTSLCTAGWLGGMTSRMRLRFFLDPETGEPRIYKHRVTEAEVEQVLGRAGEDRPGRDGARVALGRTLSGRLLRVIYVPDPQRRQSLCDYCL